MTPTNYRFLAYDKEHLLQAILQKFSSVFNFSYSFEFLEKIAHSLPADALLLIEKDETEELLKFLKFFRKQQARVIYIASTSSDADSFRKLKVEFHVDYVLQQPLDKDEMAALFRTLCHRKGESVKMPEYLTPQLLDKYREKIFEKIARLEELIDKTESAPHLKDNLLEIRNELHKITGNAAPYGFQGAGHLCSSQEIMLYNLYSGKVVHELSEVRQQNELFLRKLKLLFQNINLNLKHCPSLLTASGCVDIPSRGITDEQREERHIHLLTDDGDLTRPFQTVAAKKQLNLEIEANPDLYLRRLKTDKVLPFIIVLEERFAFTKWRGIDLIKEIQSTQLVKPLFAIMTEWDNLDKRLEWMQCGVDLVLKKPITEANVDYLFNRALKKKENAQAKILILDDDEPEGMLMKHILESIHISAVYLQDETKLFSALEEFKPDLLLLDIQMPKYNGKLLLQVLRENIHFKDLLIVVVTALLANEIDEWAYQAKCDAVIHKPLNVPVFLARISSLIARQSELNATKGMDPLTGLLLKESLLLRIDQFVTQTPEKIRCALVLLKIEPWKTLVESLKTHELNRLLLFLSELTKSHFFSAIFMGIFTGGGLAFLFKDLSGQELEFLIDSFYEKIQSKTWFTQTQHKLTANASIVLFNTKEAPLSEIFQRAEQTLSEAQNRGMDQTEICQLGATLPSSHQHDKKIILVDDDADLCDIVHFAFKQHGFDVKEFHTVAETLRYFSQLCDIEHNTLIILDRRLPDGDGIDILRRIQDQFPGMIKAIFLSSLSTEKEILKSLRSGALDYITKPFNMEVLIEKASILLSK
jgi:two-component system, cell cycle response regulator